MFCISGLDNYTRILLIQFLIATCGSLNLKSLK